MPVFFARIILLFKCPISYSRSPCFATRLMTLHLLRSFRSYLALCASMIIPGSNNNQVPVFSRILFHFATLKGKGFLFLFGQTLVIYSRSLCFATRLMTLHSLCSFRSYFALRASMIIPGSNNNQTPVFSRILFHFATLKGKGFIFQFR